MTAPGYHSAKKRRASRPIPHAAQHQRKLAQMEKSFAKSIVKDDWAAALREAYPGMSDMEIAKAAQADLGANPRTVLYWLDGSTGPSMHHVAAFAECHGQNALLRLFRKFLPAGRAHD